MLTLGNLRCNASSQTTERSVPDRKAVLETAARYLDEKSVEAFRRGVATIYPKPRKLWDRWLREDLDAAIEKLIGRPNHVRDASAVL